MNTDVTPVARQSIVKRVGRLVMDGWQNFFTGLGSAADKQKHTKNKLNIILTDEELEDIFISDGLGTNIVKAIPDDMFREGWEYEFPDVNEIKAEKLKDEYDTILENIGAVSKIKEAFYWARLYGGSVILIGALDGKDLSQPLVPSRIKPEGFEYLRIIDRSDIEFSKIKFQLDPMLPRYGLPEFYPIKFINLAGGHDIKDVHYSRIIEIHGDPIPAGADRYQKEQKYWGVSVLQNVEDRLRAVGSSVGSVSHLLNEFSVGKYKLCDFSDILSQPDGADLIKKRVEIDDLTRSVFHSMYMDKEDEFIRENVSFAGVSDVLYIIFMLVSSCTQIPITRLFGVSPAGMNSTGESDMRNYYDKVRSKQSTEAAPVLLRLIRIISEWKKLPEPYVVWNSLQQLSPKEKAEVEKMEADTEQVKASTYQAYINAGVMESYEARYLQFGDTLDKIPIPEDEQLPPVQTLPEDAPDDDENGDNSNKQGEDSDNDDSNSNTNDEPSNKEGDENNKAPPEDDDADEPDPEERIAELEEKEELSEEEQEELDDLKKQVEEAKKKKEK